MVVALFDGPQEELALSSDMSDTSDASWITAWQAARAFPAVKPQVGRKKHKTELQELAGVITEVFADCLSNCWVEAGGGGRQPFDVVEEIAQFASSSVMTVVYESYGFQDLGVPDILAMVDLAQAKNHRLGIGGAITYQLTHHNGNFRFFQILEGPNLVVQHLYEQISWDERHTVFRKASREQPVGEHHPVANFLGVKWGLYDIPWFEDRLSGEVELGPYKNVFQWMLAMYEDLNAGGV